MTSAGAWARAALVFAAVLAVDQLTKAIVRGDVAVGDQHHVIPGLHLVHVRNDGIAFGLLGGGRTWLVVLAVAGALTALIVFFALHARRRMAWLATGLLLGGAAGNIIDRVSNGAVTDWIKLPHWPAFNLADVAITAGVLVLVVVLDAPRRR